MAQWKFYFEDGLVDTKRVTTGINRSPIEAITGINVELVLTPSEARTAEESLSKLGANNIREVPDGDNLVEDTTSDNRNTVFVRAPFDYELDLTSGSITADYSAVEPGTGSFSSSVWIKPPEDNTGTVMAHRDGTGKGWDLSIDSNGNLTLTVDDGTEYSYTGSATVDDGNIHNILLSRESGSPDTYRVYDNGDIDIDETESTGDLTDGTAELEYGGMASYVYEASYYDNVAITDWFNLYDTTFTAYWPVITGSGTTISDESGNGNDATLVSGSWTELQSTDPEDTLDSGKYVTQSWETIWTQGKQHTMTLEVVDP